MVYNNVTNALRNWCAEMSEQYSQKYTGTGQSLCFLSKAVTGELWYKLGVLVDKDYPDYPAYLDAVQKLIPMHIDFVLKKDHDEVGDHYIRTAERAFRDYLATLSPDCSAPEQPYYRVIWGKEADRIADSFLTRWGYDTAYWYPLNGGWEADKLFISPKRLAPYMDELCALLGIPQEHIYEYGEAWYDRPHCAEVDALESYSGCETAYGPKDFSWIIYYSHENTVTFAGTVVPKVKELLQAERQYWNKFDWSD